MTIPRRIFHLARADFLERVRRYGFLVTLLACVYAGYAFVPPNPSSYATLKIGSYRGVYNSAWIGTAVAMLTATFVSMIGFFIVKNTIERDRRTGVGQILATTPVTRLEYTVGKTLSNFAVLSSMTLIVAVLAVGMQLIRAEDRSIDLYQLFSPFVLLTLPALMVTGAIAVLFETIPGLRGGIGNVVYVFAWGFLLGGNFARIFGRPHNDVFGTGIALPSMLDACRAQIPGVDLTKSDVSMGVNIRGTGQWVLTTFHWDGIDWTLRTLSWRLSWVLAGLGIAAVAAIPFDRFDPARAFAREPRARKRRRLRRGTRSAPDEHEETAAPSRPAGFGDATLTPLDPGARGARLPALFLAEWKLVTRGLRWWYAGPLAVAIAALAAPLSGVRAIVLPLAWAWPVLLWSRLGTRESVHATEPILFSAPHPLARQLVATWLAGVALSVLAAGPVAIRLIVAGEAGALLAWLVGAMFIPALALALGVWTGTSKFFEALYACLCYAVLQSAVPLDFMGATAEGVRRGQPAIYAALTIVLLALAALGRRRRLRG